MALAFGFQYQSPQPSAGSGTKTNITKDPTSPFRFGGGRQLEYQNWLQQRQAANQQFQQQQLAETYRQTQQSVTPGVANPYLNKPSAAGLPGSDSALNYRQRNTNPGLPGSDSALAYRGILPWINAQRYLQNGDYPGGYMNIPGIGAGRLSPPMAWAINPDVAPLPQTQPNYSGNYNGGGGYGGYPWVEYPKSSPGIPKWYADMLQWRFGEQS